MENICQFFISRKGRYCKMTVKKGHHYCGEHLLQNSAESGESGASQRIPCPNDPKHTCYAHLLEKHLKKCNARPRENPIYIIPGVNVSSSNSQQAVPLAEVEDEEVLLLIQKIRSVSEVLLTDVAEEVYQHPTLSDELSNAEYGPTTLKHRIQNASLLGHIEHANLIQPDTCYIEFGAGKGQLSFWLGKVICHYEKTLLLLIDKKSHRNSFDKQFSFKSEVSSQRLRADIADLCLGNVPEILEYRNMVAISKHLCGSATDLALRCLTADFSGATKIGVVMAPCCHYRADWDNYVGQDFLQAVGFTSRDFVILCRIASWATCGACNKRTENGEYRQSERYERLQLSPEDRAEIGRQCKRILDYGRLKYLENLGFGCKLVRYISEEVSPENMCIVGVKC